MPRMHMDPILFEVIRHRLWQINEEGGATIRLVSGSPIATEAYDFNMGLLNEKGAVLFVGPYVILHAAVLEPVVKRILDDYSSNPGVNPSDMFICSDPYAGALHQNDVTCVSPIFYNTELIAWSGCTIHQIDVGGPVPGGYSINARSIYDEPTPIPPLKIVENGAIRKDIEREYIQRSRLPQLVALDLRAKIAANNVVRRRIIDLVDRYTLKTVKEVMSEIVDHTENLFRARLRELPNGTWSHVSYIDHDGTQDKIYEVRIDMTKEDDELIFDASDSSGQAPGFINGTISSLRGGIINAVLPLLCFDIPWTPAAIWKAVTVRSKQGTVVNADWPAGVCASSILSSRAVLTAATVCIGKMLEASEKYHRCVMAAWHGATIAANFFGTDQRKEKFGTMLLDSMAGGSGARSFKDGLDNGGYLTSMDKKIANVETNEYLYPLLYLYRKTSIDSDGAGKFRGGLGGEYAVTPHDTEGRMTVILFAYGVEQPESSGISGGLPANKNFSAIIRNSDVWKQLKAGKIPSEPSEIAGARELKDIQEILPSKTITYLDKNDVMIVRFSGGGGYGDPTERDPKLVQKDVVEGLVSKSKARDVYGVVLKEDGNIDEEETIRNREQMRKRRLTISGHEYSEARMSAPTEVHRLSGNLSIAKNGGRSQVICNKCSSIICTLEDNPKRFLINNETEISNRFVLRSFCCPGCGITIDAQTTLRESPISWDVKIAES